MGENNEDTTRDWELIQANCYTQEDLQNMIHSTLHLAARLRAYPQNSAGEGRG